MLGGSAATAAARPQDALRATLGTPAWAFNPHPRCADSCCPVPCPPSGISTASAWPTGPYDGPPAAYPGLTSQALPYAAVAGGFPGLRGTAGPGRRTGLSSPWGFAGAAPPGRPPAAAARDAGGGGLGADRSGLRIGAPSMPAAAWGSLGAGASAWQGAAPPAATPGGAALDPVRGPGSGFKFAQPPPRAAAALEIPGAAARVSAAGLATPRAGSRGPGRQRTTPPKDATPDSPQHNKRLRPGDQTAGRSAGEKTPAAAKGLNFGSTPAASMAQEAASPDSGGGGEPPSPLNRVLEYGPAPARTPEPAIPESAGQAQEAASPDAGGGGEPPAPLNRVLEYGPAPARTPEPAIPESAGQPCTPPRPLDRGRERESGETPSSAQAPPRKKRDVAVAPPPAARHGLSFPAASVESSHWRGYSATVSIQWRVPGHITGVEATTAAFRHYVRRFAFSGDSDLGCCVEGRRVCGGLELCFDGIRESTVVGNEADRLRKKILNCLHNVGKRSRSPRVKNCRFSVRISPIRVLHVNDVLARIDASTPSRSEFKFWSKRPPKPPDLQASQPAEPAEKTEPSDGPAREAVARALAADIVNLRSDYDTALCMNEFAQGFNTALCLLAVLQPFIMKGPAAAARVDGPGVDRADPPAASAGAAANVRPSAAAGGGGSSPSSPASAPAEMPGMPSSASESFNMPKFALQTLAVSM